ncbi:MAG: 3-deoxy-7-phosphoheptulonate synthase [Terracidiphilus sp.]
MLVVMREQATAEEIESVCAQIAQLGFRAHLFMGTQRTAIGVTGNHGSEGRSSLEELPGVAEVIRLSKTYKLASREAHEEGTVLRFSRSGNYPEAIIGGGVLTVAAGPGAIESREQAFDLAKKVAASGAQFFHGTVFKPHASPGSSPLLGIEALHTLAAIRVHFGLRIITEAFDNESLNLAAEWVDVVQIGSSNMQNFSLLKRVGRLRKPVLLVRGPGATLEEFLLAAEYVMVEGNYEVILCEAGVRIVSGHARNVLDLSIIPMVRQLSHLPILVDLSHSTGSRESVLPMARAAIAAGADGILAEVHPEPKEAHADGPQSIYPEQFARMMDELAQIAPMVGRSLPRRDDLATDSALQSHHEQ